MITVYYKAKGRGNYFVNRIKLSIVTRRNLRNYRPFFEQHKIIKVEC